MSTTSISLLNRKVEVYDLQRSSVRMSGVCVAETKNMVLVRSGSKVKKVPKSVSVFVLDDGTRLDGRSILRRPVERLISS